MKRQSPTQTEIDELTGALKLQDFSLAVKVAERYTTKHPLVAFGWNVFGVLLAQKGRHFDSVTKFEKAIELDPHNAPAHTNLGNVYRALGRYDEAKHSYLRALEKNADNPELHYNLATVLSDLKQLAEAETHYRESIRLNPSLVEAHSNLGNVLRSSSQLQLAADCYREAIRIQPDFVLAYVNLAATLRDLNDFNQAESTCRIALKMNPRLPEALYNLGAILKMTGRLAEAEQTYRSAIDQRPDYFEALLNLGGVLKSSGKQREAQATFREAALIEPDRSEAHFALGVMHLENREFVAAFNAAQKAYALEDDHHTRGLLVDVFSRSDPTEYSSDQAELIVKALNQSWCRPQKLTRFTQALLLQHAAFRVLVERRNRTDEASCLTDVLTTLRNDPVVAMLVKSYLESAPLSSVQLEVFFTHIRGELLTAVLSPQSQLVFDDQLISFAASLSMQCFINEYVFWSSDIEQERFSQLLKRFPVWEVASPPEFELTIAVLGSYCALNTLGYCHVLLNTNLSEPIRKLISQQISEPAIEAELRNTIPALTEIDDVISRAVQEQYEENPYPRWTRIPFVPPRETINARLRRLFPLAGYVPLSEESTLEVLIAGCGTGQHPISAAGVIPNANFLAIDLSIVSLAYAKRKASELAIENISFAQADILKISGIGKGFDVIESGGVIHHMNDPYAAWDILVSLLKPNGLMKLGLYSELARRNIVRLRNENLLGESKPTRRELSRVRQGIISRSLSTEFGWLIKTPDFFSLSGCRDLLFHVHEHRMTIPAIRSYLEKRKLRFLGFEMDRLFIEAYRRNFPGDVSATDLGNWHVFERENPDTFRSMYQFWVQKI